MAQKLLAWGYEGHATITRVASELIVKDNQNHSSLVAFIKKNSGVLEHISNIPDTYWKSRNDAKRFDESSNHYVNSEILAGDKKNRDLPESKSEYLELIRNYCSKNQKECKNNLKATTLNGVGRVVFRIDQIMKKLTQKLKRIHKKQTKEIGTDVLVLMGLLSHYVGDISNPLHTTIDYDGWFREQGGIHSFFEVKIVETYGLSFDQQIYELAKNNNVVATIPNLSKMTTIQLTNWLVENSFQQLERLFKIDRNCSILNPSIKLKIKLQAKRRPAKRCTAAFRQFIAKRMSIGSSILSYLWKKAFKDSGSPDIKNLPYYYHKVLLPSYFKLD